MRLTKPADLLRMFRRDIFNIDLKTLGRLYNHDLQNAPSSWVFGKRYVDLSLRRLYGRKVFGRGLRYWEADSVIIGSDELLNGLLAIRNIKNKQNTIVVHTPLSNGAMKMCLPYRDINCRMALNKVFGKEFDYESEPCWKRSVTNWMAQQIHESKELAFLGDLDASGPLSISVKENHDGKLLLHLDKVEGVVLRDYFYHDAKRAFGEIVEHLEPYFGGFHKNVILSEKISLTSLVDDFSSSEVVGGGKYDVIQHEVPVELYGFARATNLSMAELVEVYVEQLTELLC